MTTLEIYKNTPYSCYDHFRSIQEHTLAGLNAKELLSGTIAATRSLIQRHHLTCTAELNPRHY